MLICLYFNELLERTYQITTNDFAIIGTFEAFAFIGLTAIIIVVWPTILYLWQCD